MTSQSASTGCSVTHHLPLLRRRLRRHRDAAGGRRGRHRGRRGPSGQFRPAVLEGLGAGRDAVGSRAGCCTRRSTARRAGWDEALDLVATTFREAIAEHGPDCVAFYVSGQLLTEDYYVANKLMKGFIGSANIDTNSPPLHGLGRRRPQAAPSAPTSCPAATRTSSWPTSSCSSARTPPGAIRCSTSACRSAPARAARSVVVIDPRRTATCDVADLHLPLAPGRRRRRCSTACWPIWTRAGCTDRAYIAAHTSGFADAALRSSRATRRRSTRSPRAAGVDADLLARFFDMFAGHRRTRHLLFAGRQPVGHGHRQGQRDHQLPSG